MSLILSADLSLNSSGVVIMDLEKGTRIHYESVTSDLDGLERLCYNHYRYLTLLETYKDIEYISFEGQNKQMRFNYQAGSLLALAENVGVWKLSIYRGMNLCDLHPLILEIPAQDIKIFATGNGKAEKDDMISAVNGHHIKSIRGSVPEHSVNDVADAYHLAKMTRDLILNNKDYSKYIMKDYRLMKGIS